jgi:hypothetical protein
VYSYCTLKKVEGDGTGLQLCTVMVDVQPLDSTSIQLICYFNVHIDDVLCVISV